MLRDEMTTEQTRGKSISNEKIDIWLDLRRTSITPKMALELWQAEIQDAQLDQGLSKKFPFTKCLVSHGEHNLDPSNDIDVIMMDKDESSFRFISPIQSASVGEIVSLESTQSNSPVLPDPLPLMDKFSNKQWIILDTNAWKKIDEVGKLDSIFPLIELITSTKARDKNGRIGWTCHSKNEVIKSAMWIRYQTNISERNIKTLPSGIIIPGDTVANAPAPQDSDNAMFVIVVPYDVGILRTAMSFVDNTVEEVLIPRH